MSDGNNVDAAKERLYRVRRSGGKIIPVNMAEGQRQSILEYDKNLQSDGKHKTARRVKVLDCLRYWTAFLPIKDWKEMSEAELREGVIKLEESKMKPSTKEGLKVILKQFYTWLEGEDGVPPKKVKWLSVDMKKYSLRANYHELLSPQEVDWLVECAPDLKMKLLIRMCYESAFRIHELLQLKMCMIIADDNGFRISTSEDSKTGVRQVRILDSAPLLQEYLKNHPCKSEPDAPLFGLYHGGRWRPMSYILVRQKMSSLTKKARNLHPSMVSKKCHLHGLRKARLSEIAAVLPEQVLKNYAGWTPNSGMARVYISISDKVNDSVILDKLYGRKTVEQNGIKRLIKPCPHCRKENDSSYSMCESCGRVLSGGDAIKIDLSTDEMRMELLTLKKQVSFINENLVDKKTLETTLTGILAKGLGDIIEQQAIARDRRKP